MEIESAFGPLTTLGQSSRLTVFRRFVEMGWGGPLAGELVDAPQPPAAGLLFHPTMLAAAGLARSALAGRFIYYFAEFDTMRLSMVLLTEHCRRSADVCRPSKPMLTSGVCASTRGNDNS